MFHLPARCLLYHLRAIWRGIWRHRQDLKLVISTCKLYRIDIHTWVAWGSLNQGRIAHQIELTLLPILQASTWKHPKAILLVYAITSIQKIVVWRTNRVWFDCVPPSGHDVVVQCRGGDDGTSLELEVDVPLVDGGSRAQPWNKCFHCGPSMPRASNTDGIRSEIDIGHVVLQGTIFCTGMYNEKSDLEPIWFRNVLYCVYLNIE